MAYNSPTNWSRLTNLAEASLNLISAQNLYRAVLGAVLLGGVPLLVYGTDKTFKLSGSDYDPIDEYVSGEAALVLSVAVLVGALIVHRNFSRESRRVRWLGRVSRNPVTGRRDHG